MKKAIIVRTKSEKKGYVYYDNNHDLTNEKLQVIVIDDKFKETGEKLLCSPDTLTVIGHKD